MQTKSEMAELLNVSTPHLKGTLRMFLVRQIGVKELEQFSQKWVSGGDCFQENETNQRDFKNWEKLSFIVQRQSYSLMFDYSCIIHLPKKAAVLGAVQFSLVNQAHLSR